MSLVTLIHNVALSSVSPGGLPQEAAGTGNIKNILGIAFGIIGGLALLMIVISAFRYIISDGDPQRMSKAKSGVIYALVGLVVAISAEAIVSFVGNRL
jgi:hypothetical protein